MPETCPETKQDLRRLIREKMRSVSAEERGAWSAALLEHLRAQPDWVPAGGIVTLFGGMASEPNLLPLLPWLRERGLRTAFFAIEGEVMTPYLVEDEQDLVPGKLGVLEPWRNPQARVELQDISVALVPGLAFSLADGTRLGRGKGHYDRALSRMTENTRPVGICFSAQLLPTVPCESHDRKVCCVVTEQGWSSVGNGC